MPTAPAKIDVRRLISERFNGRKQLHERLVRRGHNVTGKMIDKWVERGRIPGPWLLELHALAAEDGTALELGQWMDTTSGQSELSLGRVGAESILD